MGTPQGGIISPLLANIYLHYVLDLWFEKKVKPIAKGHVELIRYCDDFVVCCESEKDAKEFLSKLQTRLGKFGLEISKDKTKVLKFGRQVWKRAQKQKGKVETLTFLDSHIIVVRVDEDILLWDIKPVKKIYVVSSRKPRNG